MIDNNLLLFILIALTALLISAILTFFKQPSVIAYILTGAVFSAIGIISDKSSFQFLGDIGVVLLLFFVGMELDISKLVARKKIAILGFIFQIVISFILVWLISSLFSWPMYRIILISFVISLSSTAVVIKILEREKLLTSDLGVDLLSLLIVQDLAVIPMLLILSFVGGTYNGNELPLQLVGSLLIAAFIFWLFKKKSINIKFSRYIKDNHELQLLTALVLCFGFSLITSFFNISAGLGAFVAGLFIGSTKETAWVKQSLESFKTIFVALFFISIGLLMDIPFLLANIFQIMVVVFLVFLTNTIINALTFRSLRQDWCYCWYAGSLLAQIGEFSFLLTAAAFQVKSITLYAYNLTIAVIAVSLFLSPFWIALFSRLVTNKVCIVPVSQRYGKKE